MNGIKVPRELLNDILEDENELLRKSMCKNDSCEYSSDIYQLVIDKIEKLLKQ